MFAPKHKKDKSEMTSLHCGENMQGTSSNFALQASIVMPALNEAETIGMLLDEIKRKLENKIDAEIIVVDGGSSDATYLVAKEAGAKTIRTDHYLGYGEALKEGFSCSNFSTIVVFDASGEYDPKLILDGLKLLSEKKADIAVAYYPFSRSLLHRLGMTLISFELRLLFNLRISGDLSSTFICFGREVLDKVKLASNDLGITTEFLIKANAKGYRIVEFPVESRRRLGTKPRGTAHRLRLGLQYMSAIIRNIGEEPKNGID